MQVKEFILSGYGLMSIIIFFSSVAFYAIIWGNRTFSVKTLNQMIFHMKVPMDGTDGGIFKDLFLNTFFQSLFTTLIIELVLFQCFGYWTSQHVGLIIAIDLIALALRALFNYQIPGYIVQLIQKTNLYENYYVAPQDAKLEFPKQKRNLIHIYLESVENTYLSQELGGHGKENYMPELGTLANQNINFSFSDSIGGPKMVEGTQWTIASQVAQEAGIPLLLPYNSKKYNDESLFFPGVCSIGELLEKEGYYNEVMMGSNSRFAGTYNFYQQHGHYHIFDHQEALKQGRLPKDYHVFWGFEDTKLFDFAKEDITKQYQEGHPFNFDIVTIDTHTPDGYVCEHCQNRYDSQYANVIACQSRLINEFVEWCQKQPWYENTTIVITGDHNSMSEKFFGHIDSDYLRTPYNCMINSVQNNKDHLKNRQFTTFDFYPTILASMGITIEGERLGLGTNLFSNKKTIMEEMGYKKLNGEIKKRSKYYQNQFIKK